MKCLIINTGGTLGMMGNPLRPAMDAKQLMRGINVPTGMTLTLYNAPILLDSTNVTHEYRVSYGLMVRDDYDKFDAFVILHGTDTLAETCAFLSLMFGYTLQKPVFVVGSQLPKNESGSDATIQLSNTLRAAKLFVEQRIVGVYTVCMNRVLAGTRVVKRHGVDFDVFHTPGVQPVAEIGPQVYVYPRPKRRADSILELDVNVKYEPMVATLVVSADTPPFVLEGIVSDGIIKGVILVGKGVGNIPDRRTGPNLIENSWVDAIRFSSLEMGVPVAILSPFQGGMVDLDRYELGKAAKKAGALSLGSLTPAMADAKFRFAIRRFAGRHRAMQDYLDKNSLGELLPGKFFD